MKKRISVHKYSYGCWIHLEIMGYGNKIQINRKLEMFLQRYLLEIRNYIGILC